MPPGTPTGWTLTQDGSTDIHGPAVLTYCALAPEPKLLVKVKVVRWRRLHKI